MIEINFKPTPRLLRQFAWLLAGVLALAGAWLVVRWSLPWASVAWCLAILSLIIGWLKPAAMRPIYLTWMVAAFPIGWLMSHLMLAVVFYLVITPVGLV